MTLSWNDALPPDAWDAALARLGGHPLQSALWGGHRATAEGLAEHRWAALVDGAVVWMGRFEVRWLPARAGRVAWMPKGPVCADPEIDRLAHAAFLDRLRAEGYWLAIENRYEGRAGTAGGTASRPYRTIWIDLSQGREAIWKGLHRQWRYHVRVAERDGVEVGQTTDPAEIAHFYGMCHELSEKKGFSLPGSKALMQALLASTPGADTEARLFVARYDGRLAAGVTIVRCGASMHFFWGATDRAYGKHYVGEAVQWAAIEWGLAEGLKRYDLEGINPERNPGVYRFKKRMGGEEVELPGKVAFPLDWRGRLALRLKPGWAG